MKCENCNGECQRDEVDVGVDVMHGPYGCPNCGWSEYDEYNQLTGEKRDESGQFAYDQFGGMYRAPVEKKK